jgi:hypothetical protein
MLAWIRVCIRKSLDPDPSSEKAWESDPGPDSHLSRRFDPDSDPHATETI